jgi:hypothetical protein
VAILLKTDPIYHFEELQVDAIGEERFYIRITDCPKNLPFRGNFETTCV